MRPRHRRVVLETIAADIPHQFGKTWHLNHRLGSERIKRIIGEASLSNIRANLPGNIVRTNAAKRHRPSGCASCQSTYSIRLTQNSTQDGCGSDPDVREKILCPVAAMEEDTFIILVPIVIVPVHECRGTIAGKL